MAGCMECHTQAGGTSFVGGSLVRSKYHPLRRRILRL
jgi:hypothetical protein